MERKTIWIVVAALVQVPVIALADRVESRITNRICDGEKVGTATPDNVCTVEWKGVALKEGYNTIELKTASLSDSCTWRWTKVRKTVGCLSKWCSLSVDHV